MSTVGRVFLELLKTDRYQSCKEMASTISVDKRTVERAVVSLKNDFESDEGWDEFFELKSNDNFEYIINSKYLLNKEQTLFLSKLVVSSRSLNPDEFPEVVNKMLSMVNLSDRKVISSSIATERTTATFIDDKSPRLDKIWQLEKYISDKKRIRFQYNFYEEAEDFRTDTIELLPVHTFFDNYYFFLVGYDGKEYKTFRIDWMTKIEIISNKISNHDRSKRHDHGQETQLDAFGYMGEKTRIKFEYYGYIGYVKDKFPSCRVVKKLDKDNLFPFSVNELEIEVNYSWGVKLWLLGQSTILRVTSPKNIADDIKTTLQNSSKLYD